MICPRCGSNHVNSQAVTETVTNQKVKGFGIIKACLGFSIFNIPGILCGLCGMGKGRVETRSHTKVIHVCQNCGNTFQSYYGLLVTTVVAISSRKEVFFIKENSSLFAQDVRGLFLVSFLLFYYCSLKKFCLQKQLSCFSESWVWIGYPRNWPFVVFKKIS